MTIKPGNAAKELKVSTLPVASSISGSVGCGGVDDRNDVLTVQRLINGKLPIPLRPVDEEGVRGPLTILAIEGIQRRNLRTPRPDRRIDPNGAAIKISNDPGIDPNDWMAAMAFESGETFRASVNNAASGATGLIQFMPPTATSLGTSD